MPKTKCLKMIGNKNFTLELIEADSGSYYVVTEKDEIKYTSPPIRDLKVAFETFDTTLIRLEGN